MQNIGKVDLFQAFDKEHTNQMVLLKAWLVDAAVANVLKQSSLKVTAKRFKPILDGQHWAEQWSQANSARLIWVKLEVSVTIMIILIFSHLSVAEKKKEGGEDMFDLAGKYSY